MTTRWSGRDSRVLSGVRLPRGNLIMPGNKGKGWRICTLRYVVEFRILNMDKGRWDAASGGWRKAPTGSAKSRGRLQTLLTSLARCVHKWLCVNELKGLGSRKKSLAGWRAGPESLGAGFSPLAADVLAFASGWWGVLPGASGRSGALTAALSQSERETGGATTGRGFWNWLLAPGSCPLATDSRLPAPTSPAARLRRGRGRACVARGGFRIL